MTIVISKPTCTLKKPYLWSWLQFQTTVRIFLGLFWENEYLQYTGHYIFIYNLRKNHGKRTRFFCFVPYKMGIIPFSNHISWILVLSPLFSFLYIKFTKNCCSDPFWQPLWNFSEGKITKFWYFWNNCPINFRMVYRFQYITTLLLIKNWFSLWTKKLFTFPQYSINYILPGVLTI